MGEKISINAPQSVLILLRKSIVIRHLNAWTTVGLGSREGVKMRKYSEEFELAGRAVTEIQVS